MRFEFTSPGLRDGLRWLNRRRSLVALVQAGREVLPGDSDFGDPMSTAGTSAAHVLGRRAWTLQDGRFSLLGELALAGLQVADWLGEDIRGVSSAEEQAILFADLGGFSRWALNAGDGEVADLLRNADAVITAAVESREGVVVKRLGDGVMAIFAECEAAVDAAFAAIAAVRRINVDSYRPELRAGVHVGRPQRIGSDYVGVDVNIAARLCEAAPEEGVLVSGPVRDGIPDRWPTEPVPDRRLRGVPDHISMYRVTGRADRADDGDRPESASVKPAGRK
jgi:class 3 adenylate cyclase